MGRVHEQCNCSLKTALVPAGRHEERRRVRAVFLLRTAPPRGQTLAVLKMHRWLYEGVGRNSPDKNKNGPLGQSHRSSNASVVSRARLRAALTKAG